MVHGTRRKKQLKRKIETVYTRAFENLKYGNFQEYREKQHEHSETSGSNRISHFAMSSVLLKKKKKRINSSFCLTISSTVYIHT